MFVLQVQQNFYSSFPNVIRRLYFEGVMIRNSVTSVQVLTQTKASTSCHLPSVISVFLNTRVQSQDILVTYFIDRYFVKYFFYFLLFCLILNNYLCVFFSSASKQLSSSQCSHFVYFITSVIQILMKQDVANLEIFPMKQSSNINTYLGKLFV